METTLLQLGVAGVVLIWLMYRVETRMDRLERALDHLARAQILSLVAHPDVADSVKAQAQAVLIDMGPPPAGTYNQHYTEAARS